MSDTKVATENAATTEDDVTLEKVTELALRLPPLDKIRLIERLVPGLDQVLMPVTPTPRRSLLGLCEDLGPAPSAEEIDEARREAWANFPREQFYE